MREGGIENKGNNFEELVGREILDILKRRGGSATTSIIISNFPRERKAEVLPVFLTIMRGLEEDGVVRLAGYSKIETVMPDDDREEEVWEMVESSANEGDTDDEGPVISYADFKKKMKGNKAQS